MRATILLILVLGATCGARAGIGGDSEANGKATNFKRKLCKFRDFLHGGVVEFELGHFETPHIRALSHASTCAFSLFDDSSAGDDNVSTVNATATISSHPPPKHDASKPPPSTGGGGGASTGTGGGANGGGGGSGSSGGGGKLILGTTVVRAKR